MPPALAIALVAALVAIAVGCFYRHVRISRAKPPISDYEIALTGDRRTADVSNVVDIFGAHSGGANR